MGALLKMLGKGWKCQYCGDNLTDKEVFDRTKMGIDLKVECECDSCWTMFFEKAEDKYDQ